MKVSWGPSVVLLCAGLTLFGPSSRAAAQLSGSGHPGSWRGDKITASQSFQVGDSTIQVDFASGDLDLPQPRLLAWVRASAQSVAQYYGQFPVARARVIIEPIAGDRDSIHGTTWGGVGGVPALTRIRIGQHVTEKHLEDDWVMTHEFVHTALPDLDDEQSWMEEGLATYIEPIARARTGRLPEWRVWAEFLHEMQYGEPGANDGGLNGNRSWGRTYWGGALFCLVADLNIRQQTHNQKGLEDAMSAVVRAGGGIDKDWPLARVLAIADRATGTTVLTGMYAEWSRQPVPVDLDKLWSDLGVKPAKGTGVDLNDAAPLAAIRSTISASQSALAEK
jgi:hypothetical protein